MIPPEITANGIELKPYLPKDEESFVFMNLDEDVKRFMSGSEGIAEEERKLFKGIFEIYEGNDKRWFWIWGIYKNQRLCGHLELKETEHTQKDELEMVYMVHPKERRKGIITAVLTTLKQYQHVWKKRIIATVSPENKNSLGALEKWGIERREICIDRETAQEYLKLVLKP